MKDGLFNDSLVIWKWKARYRSWQREAETWSCSRAIVLIDPLIPLRKRNISAKEQEVKQPELTEFADPLGATIDDCKKNTIFTDDIPIISMRKEEPKLANTLISKDDEIVTITEKELPGFTPWSSKKRDILKSFSNANDSKISYLHCVPDLKKTDLLFVKRTAQRLEQLEDLSGWKKLAEQSQEENLTKINELRKNLEIAWAKEKKLESVNLAIEVANILGLVPEIDFYPHQFVLVTDVLDEFGYMVYNRLYTKANKERAEAGLNQLPNNFTVDDVPKQTRNIARNWFCKIGGITEFLSRFYVETALIGCIRFFDAESLSVNLLRLAKIPISLPNPLVSCYARAYLCRVAMRLTPNDRAPHWRCLNDWINTISIQSMPELMPALEWIIQCVTYNATTYDELKTLWEICADNQKRSTFLLPFLLALPSDYLSQHALDACKLVVGTENVTCMELCVFGRRLMENSIKDELKRIILKNCWQKVIHLVRIRDFIECTIVWIEFAARYFTLNEIDVMLETVIKRITPDKKYEAFMDELLCIVEKITQWVDEMKDLVVSQHFQTLVDLFRNAQLRGNCASTVLSAFTRSCDLASVDDFQLATQILEICQILHDSLNALSTDEEKQRANFYIIRALDRFKLEADPERALDFFVDARAAFSNLDSVIAYLATKVCSLGFYVVRQGKISHAGETFLRACIAYIFITIASLSNSATKIEIYIQAGMLSLTSNSLPQADAILKCSVEVLAAAHDLKVSVYHSVCSSFLAFLVLAPDPPNKNPLYMFNAFLNAIARYPWRNESLEHGRVLLECICYLSIMSQSELPYHVAYGGVQSNDTLYGGAKEFMELIEEKCEMVMGRLEDVYKQDKEKLSLLAVEILEVILSLGDVMALATLVVELYGDCSATSELRKRRELILSKIQKFARKNAELIITSNRLNKHFGMDDFIFPEDIDEENIDTMDLDAGGSGITVSGEDNRELEPKSENVISVDHCAEAMGDTLKKYKEVKKRVVELSFGVRLQAEMDKCATERRNFPLQIALKRQKLNSGASLLMIQLWNNSPFEMIEWHLALTTSSFQAATNDERKDKIFTKIIPIKRLSQHSEFTYEVFCTHNLPISLFFRVHLLKCIHFSGNREPRAFRIALEPIYLTHWDTVIITAVPENITNRVVQYARTDEEQKITLPDALVYLICGEKQTEATLLKWIINTVTDECDGMNCVVLDDENIRWPFSIEVKKQGLSYDVVLRMKNAKMRCTLISELQIRIIIRMQYIWKELKEKEGCELLLDSNSLPDCFASLIAKYKR